MCDFSSSCFMLKVVFRVQTLFYPVTSVWLHTQFLQTWTERDQKSPLSYGFSVSSFILLLLTDTAN